MELLSPAGSREALEAAVQSGADAVYMGFGAFNARRSAKNFTDDDFAAAVHYCHLHGVKVYLTLNTLLTDRELPQAADALKKGLCHGGRRRARAGLGPLAHGARGRAGRPPCTRARR